MAGLRRSRWLRVPLGALALAAVAWLAWYGLARWQLERTKDSLRAAGLPMTTEEVIPAPIPEDENAASLLERAEPMWIELKSRGDFVDARVGSNAPELAPEKFDQDRLAQLQAQMQRPDTQELFRLMQDAARRPAAVFDRDYAKGAAVDIGPLNPLFSAVQFFGTKAWLAAREGNQKDAADDLLTVSRLASFALRDVLLLGWIIGASFDQLSITSAQSVIAELPPGSFRKQDWQALDDSWAQHAAAARDNLVGSMDGERVLVAMWMLEQVISGQLLLRQEVPKVVNAWYPDETGRVRWMTGFYETALAPLLVSDYAAYLRLMLSVRETVQNGRTGASAEESFARNVPGWALIARKLASSYDGTRKLLEDYEVNLQLGRLGLALEDFRSHEGKYPATLPDLGLPEATITDPFTGRPFIYRTERDNVLVYSVGFDREDDGGVPRASGGRRDLVWRIERDEVGHE